MSENKLVGSLVLRTIDIAPITSATCSAANAILDNEYGYIAANGGYVTWRNVNIRTCLGELYQKYNRFNLKLTAAQLRHNTVAATSDGQFLIYITGLPFSSGSTYSTRLGPSNQACLGAVNYATPSNLVGVTASILSGLVSFDKPLQDIMNITIELKNSSTTIVNGYTEKLGTVLGHWIII